MPICCTLQIGLKHNKKKIVFFYKKKRARAGRKHPVAPLPALFITVSQKNKFLLDALVELYGGKIYAMVKQGAFK
jgi:hypothetical protein